jgi:hypothetical protein
MRSLRNPPRTPAYTAAQQTARILDIHHVAETFVATGTPVDANAVLHQQGKNLESTHQCQTESTTKR